ncbi:thioredoxin reductase 1, cytoplasmic-like isoform X2 [Periplaneta americana]|uniref:thioredoxin reductase 1, cytoplasmic-like isoform X2 n=1 Tax=Periplaneta americana TaxID=6978 RepID=UPI0037E96E7B
MANNLICSCPCHSPAKLLSCEVKRKVIILHFSAEKNIHNVCSGEGRKVGARERGYGLQQVLLSFLFEREGQEIQQYLFEKTKQKTVPNVFVNGNHIGGCDATFQAHANGRLNELLAGVQYNYDLIIIGGGSGGLAASKEAAALGQKVAVCDFVNPSPHGTTWGLGGTCVNVGCIPKKLMHKASIIGEDIRDAKAYGWEVPDNVNHNWQNMVTEVQNYIKSLNFGYRKVLKEKCVTYINAYAKFVDNHTVEVVDKKDKVQHLTARDFIIAVGGRPNYPDIPGALEYSITSDDLFSLKHNPGKCLIIGASYIALECAGFLRGLGMDTTVMVRSILLRGFDQQLAEMIGDHMQSHGVKFIRPCVPTKIEEIKPGQPGVYKVTAEMSNGEMVEGEYNTVLFAVGRTACTKNIELENIGVQINPRNAKVVVDEKEQTSVPNIYAIGDVIDGKLELTPVAIQSGKLLAQRLYGNKKTLTDYVNVPTTVFTPLEYGFVGLSEEDANAKYGSDNIEVYHSFFQPLEFSLTGRDDNKCYGKLVCVKNEEERVVGFHILGPNAGEITQGFAIGVKLGAKKSDFANLIGIHPTSAEIFTTMNTTKSSGETVAKTSC